LLLAIPLDSLSAPQPWLVLRLFLPFLFPLRNDTDFFPGLYVRQSCGSPPPPPSMVGSGSLLDHRRSKAGRGQLFSRPSPPCRGSFWFSFFSSFLVEPEGRFVIPLRNMEGQSPNPYPFWLLFFFSTADTLCLRSFLLDVISLGLGGRVPIAALSSRPCPPVFFPRPLDFQKRDPGGRGELPLQLSSLFPLLLRSQFWALLRGPLDATEVRTSGKLTPASSRSVSQMPS